MTLNINSRIFKVLTTEAINFININPCLCLQLVSNFFRCICLVQKLNLIVSCHFMIHK